MELRYICLIKDNIERNIQKDEEHYKILNKLFKNVNDSEFKFINEDEVNIINYNAYYSNDGSVFKLDIGLDNKNDCDIAKVLCKVDNLIRRGKVRKDYNIILMYDEISEYYGNKAYKIINRLERKLRELVYIILIKTFGIKWYDETITKELDKKIRETSHGKSKTQLIEGALQEMTFNDLEIYLFKAYPDEAINRFEVDWEKNKEFIYNNDKEDIIGMLSNYIPKCLWERFFKDIFDVVDMESYLKSIRNYRNKIAHNKEFHFDEYIKCNQLTKNVLIKIDDAINKINNNHFDLSEGISAFVKLSPIIAKKSKIIEPPLRSMFGELAKQAKALSTSVTAGLNGVNKALDYGMFQPKLGLNLGAISTSVTAGLNGVNKTLDYGIQPKLGSSLGAISTSVTAGLNGVNKALDYGMFQPKLGLNLGAISTSVTAGLNGVNKTLDYGIQPKLGSSLGAISTSVTAGLNGVNKTLDYGMFQPKLGLNLGAISTSVTAGLNGVNKTLDYGIQPKLGSSLGAISTSVTAGLNGVNKTLDYGIQPKLGSSLGAISTSVTAGLNGVNKTLDYGIQPKLGSSLGAISTSVTAGLNGVNKALDYGIQPLGSSLGAISTSVTGIKEGIFNKDLINMNTLRNLDIKNKGNRKRRLIKKYKNINNKYTLKVNKI